MACDAQLSDMLVCGNYAQMRHPAQYLGLYPSANLQLWPLVACPGLCLLYDVGLSDRGNSTATAYIQGEHDMKCYTAVCWGALASHIPICHLFISPATAINAGRGMTCKLASQEY